MTPVIIGSAEGALVRVAQDTTGAGAAAGAAAAGAVTGGAYVARPGGPPDTASYMWAGYAITLIVYAAYILLLQRRIARTRSASRAGASRAGRNLDA